MGEVAVDAVREALRGRGAKDNSKESVNKQSTRRVLLVSDEVGDEDGGENLAEEQDRAIPLDDAEVERNLEDLEKPIAETAELVEGDRSDEHDHLTKASELATGPHALLGPIDNEPVAIEDRTLVHTIRPGRNYRAVSLERRV